MRFTDSPVRDLRPAMRELRRDLIALLSELSEAQWSKPTEAGQWTVKHVALHLLDDELGWLSRERDGDPTGLLATGGDYRDFVAALDAKNRRWVEASSALSCQVVTDLLSWSGDQVDRWHRTLDLDSASDVIWAGGSVPRWFDLARDFTEYWVHQQHIRDAVARPGDHARFLPDVLRTFVWAFPHQFHAAAPEGTQVGLDFGAGGAWTLYREPAGWRLDEGSALDAAASLSLESTAAWRQLTGLPVDRLHIVTRGPARLTDPLLGVRGIIA